MAAWALGTGVQVTQIRHSGKRRAEQTAALLAERLTPPEGVIATLGLKPDDEPRPVADLLQGERAPLMIVSHLPFLGRLADLLLDGRCGGLGIRFQTGEMVCLAPQAGKGKWSLEWVMSPDLL
jgi:phosphohistidine phosphatase